MAGSLNKVQLIGRLGADPEIRSAGNSKVANMRVATSVTWKDKRSGEREEKTEWHQIAVWNEATIDFIEQYLTKGQLVYIEGALETREWTDKDDVKRYSTEVVVRPYSGQVTSLDSSGGSKDDDDRGSSRRGRGRDRDDDRDADRSDDRRSRGGRARSRDDDDGDRGRDRDDGEGRRSSRSSRDDDGDRGSSRSADRGRSRSSRDLDDDIPF